MKRSAAPVAPPSKNIMRDRPLCFLTLTNVEIILSKLRMLAELYLQGLPGKSPYHLKNWNTVIWLRQLWFKFWNLFWAGSKNGNPAWNFDARTNRCHGQVLHSQNTTQCPEDLALIATAKCPGCNLPIIPASKTAAMTSQDAVCATEPPAPTIMLVACVGQLPISIVIAPVPKPTIVDVDGNAEAWIPLHRGVPILEHPN